MNLYQELTKQIRADHKAWSKAFVERHMQDLIFTDTPGDQYRRDFTRDQKLIPRKTAKAAALCAYNVPGHPDELLVPIPTHNIDNITCGLFTGTKLLVDPKQPLHPAQKAYENKEDFNEHLTLAAKHLRENSTEKGPCGFAAPCPEGILRNLRHELKDHLNIRKDGATEKLINKATHQIYQTYAQWALNLEPGLRKNLDALNEIYKHVPYIPAAWAQQLIEDPKYTQWFARYPDILRRALESTLPRNVKPVDFPSLLQDIQEGKPDQEILKSFDPKGTRKLTPAERKASAKRTHQWLESMLLARFHNHRIEEDDQRYLQRTTPYGTPYRLEKRMYAIEEMDQQISYLDYETGELQKPETTHLIWLAALKDHPNVLNPDARDHIIPMWGDEDWYPDSIKHEGAAPDSYIKTLRKISQSDTEAAYQAKTLPHEFEDCMQAVFESGIADVIRIKDPEFQLTIPQAIHMAQKWKQGVGLEVANAKMSAEAENQDDCKWSNPKLETESPWQIIPLESPLQMRHEGQTMKNCIGTMVASVTQKQNYLYGIRHAQDSNKHGSLQITYRNDQWQIVQALAEENEPLHPDTEKIVQQLVEDLNQRQPKGPTQEQDYALEQAQAKLKERDEIDPQALEKGKSAARKVLFRHFPKLRRMVRIPDKNPGRYGHIRFLHPEENIWVICDRDHYEQVFAKKTKERRSISP